MPLGVIGILSVCNAGDPRFSGRRWFMGSGVAVAVGGRGVGVGLRGVGMESVRLRSGGEPGGNGRRSFPPDWLGLERLLVAAFLMGGRLGRGALWL